MRNILKLAMVSVIALPLGTMAYATEVKKWTQLIYVAYDNGNSEAVRALKRDLNNLNGNSRVNLVVQLDSREGGERLAATSGPFEKVQDLGEPASGEWQELSDFLTWGMIEYPAEKFSVSLYMPGSDDQFGYDESSGSALSIADITRALGNANSLLAQLRNSSTSSLQLDLFDIAVPSYGGWTSPPTALIHDLQDAHTAQAYLTQRASVGTFHIGQMVIPAILGVLTDPRSDEPLQAAQGIAEALSPGDGYFSGYFWLGPDPL